jgi:Tol biopolymer transport system component
LNSARDQQIRALFRAALDRPAAERASFVADLSGGDDELRKSVELMLSQHGATDVGARAASAPSEPLAELPAGAMLAHYRVEGVIGRGGMGVVYRATDTKLNRPVAIKFLSAAVTDADVRRRFRQEATTTSGLNHPHIVTVHDVGEHDGRQYIVSELVDGGTLEDWSAASRHRTWRQCVELVTGVADGLAAAHAAGVLHRDVKPGNILIGANGYAKLADFGLAKLVDSGAPGAAQASAGRTTRAGVVVGTVAYMSPEQTTGQPLDARSDVFSFGIVLYELLAGRRPFEAANDLGVLKAIAHEDPAPLPDTVPELLRMAVDKALEKEPADRYQTMQDLVADLRRVARKSASSHAVTAAPRRRTVYASTAAAAAVALLALGALAGYFWPEPVPTPQAPVRFTIETEGLATGVAVSPDGRYIAYTAGPSTEAGQIYLRALGSLESRVLGGTRGAQAPFWSPDSAQVGFWSSEGWIKRVAIAEGGSPQNVVRTGVAGGGSWNEDGTIVFDSGSGLKRVPVSGGEAVQATTIQPDEGAHALPYFLPDGRRFLFSAVFRKPGLYVQSLDSPTRTQVSNIPSIVAYAAGRLLFTRGPELFAQPFDVDRLQPSGEPTRVADGLFLVPELPIGVFSASNGVIAYVRGNSGAVLATAPTQLAWYDRGGKRIAVVGEPGPYRGLALSPDGKRIAMHRHEDEGGGDIWILDLERSTLTRLTFGPGHAFGPSWSPDGEVVLYTAGDINLYQKRSSGVDSEELVLKSLRFPFMSSFLPDGATLLLSYIGSDSTNLDVAAVPLTGDNKDIPVTLANTPFMEGSPTASQDGRWVAYVSDESGRREVYVRPYPSASGRWQISTAGGDFPRWARDGRALFYVTLDGTLMEVAVDSDERTFSPRTPQALFSARFASKPHSSVVGILEDAPYDIAPDGQRFLVNEFVDSASVAEPGARAAPANGTIAVIVNWASEL